MNFVFTKKIRNLNFIYLKLNIRFRQPLEFFTWNWHIIVKIGTLMHNLIWNKEEKRFFSLKLQQYRKKKLRGASSWSTKKFFMIIPNLCWKVLPGFWPKSSYLSWPWKSFGNMLTRWSQFYKNYPKWNWWRLLSSLWRFQNQKPSRHSLYFYYFGWTSKEN